MGICGGRLRGGPAGSWPKRLASALIRIIGLFLRDIYAMLNVVLRLPGPVSELLLMGSLSYL